MNKETLKTIALTAIIAAHQISFVCGVRYEQSQSSKTQAAVHDALKAVATPAPVAQASKK